jgi:formylglycine-generating enzyme required for sulfatase activity
MKSLNNGIAESRLRTRLGVLATAGLLMGSAWLAMGAGSGDWAAAMLARRTALQSGPDLVESPWQTSGPLAAKSFSEALFPEQGVDLQAVKNGKPVWKKVEIADGVVHPLQAGASTANYFYRTFIVKEGRPLRIGLGSDDGVECWVNGEKVLSNDVPRGVTLDADVIQAKLNAGTNTVLVKIFNRTGDSGIYFNTDASTVGAIGSVARNFPAESGLFSKHISAEQWFTHPENTQIEQQAAEALLKHLQDATPEREKLAALVQAKTPPTSPEWIQLVLSLAGQVTTFEQARAELPTLDLTALRLAIEDLNASFPGKYTGGSEFLKAVQTFEKDLPALKAGLENGDQKALAALSSFKEVRRQALLANPLLDFDKVLLVKRNEGNLCLPQNWQGNTSVNPQVENEIATLEYKKGGAALETFYKPEKNYYVGDVDLNFDADKMLFSSIGTHNRWQVFEIKTDRTGLRQITPADEPDIDCYDPVYLPDGRIIFDSTSTFQGVPCVGGSDWVANLHLMNADGTSIRRLCFDQDNDWYPVVMPSGRIMYLRWEYTDSAHYFSRVMMSMNPDGTGQMELYGSNSYWPNSLFYARPVPGKSSKFVGIVSGHHGVARMGEMVVFDVSKGRQENSGAVQRIPGRGKPVEDRIKDELVADSWPKFLHPYPLSDKYYLVSSKPTPSSQWGLYLVDTFDNMLLLKEEPGYALFEPLPFRKTDRPPVIADKVKLAETNATVYLHDIYTGPGLKDVARGTVKQLRLFQYEYSYRNQGGHYFVGMEGGWDVRRVIGTVPVESDGSAMFKIPANTPVALQPLDQEGKALQLMRSWFVGMPGEVVSCVGCHEKQNSAATPKLGIAARKAPVEPAPWHGPKRGFSFLREVQPVLDKYCVGCHNGKEGRPNFADTKIIPTSGGISDLPVSYLNLHPYVRRNGPEGDYHTLTPLEFHANTSLLVQMLRKGHYNVKMDAEGWDRLLTWIDINVPAYGTYHEVAPIPSNFEKRRYDSKKKYANVDEDIEAIPAVSTAKVEFVKPEPPAPRPTAVSVDGWPLSPDAARKLQADLGDNGMALDLGNSQAIALKKIPAGQFAMGAVDGALNEFPMTAVKISKPFWMGATEISLRQYQQFDPNHRNGYYDQHYKDQVRPGYLMDAPDLPVIRVNWNQAMSFCKWLSARTGKKVTLPTEAQWEWACRAGSSTPMFYGDLNSDFSTYANLADATISKLAVSGVDPQPIPNPDKFWDYVPKEARFNDGVLMLAEVGHYQPNPWGLQNMIGNVAEWTLDDYRPYPYKETAPSKAGSDVSKVVRGGSWSERPRESTASARLDYPAWQHVYNVGFRVIVTE